MDLEKLAISNAAGTAKTVEDVRRLARSAATRITVGSITAKPRSGNTGETYYFNDRTNTSLNSIGLRNEGLEWYHAAGKLNLMRQIAQESGKELWASVAGFSPPEFVELAEICFLCGVDGVELNLGCPNVHDAGVSKPIFSYRPALVEEVLNSMEIFAAGNKKIGVKLSPVPDSTLKELAMVISASRIVTEVVAVNTLPEQELTKEDGSPALSYVPQGANEMRHKGGLAGAPLLQEGVRVVQTLKEHLVFGHPIIGVGGIFSGEDAKKYIDAGASGFEVGTAYYNHEDESIFSDIAVELAQL